MKIENINPYAFISKKMRVIITTVKPIISLKRSPPHNVIKKNLSDRLILRLIDNMPNVKFISESKAPNNIDLYNKPDRLEERNKTVTIVSNRMETVSPEVIRNFSFLIISGFHNRFNKGIQTSEHSQECKNYSHNWICTKLPV